MSEVFSEIPCEIMDIIFSRDTLFDGLDESQIYLSCLRWARGFGDLNTANASNFDTTNIEEGKTEQLRSILKHVRLPLVKAYIIIKYIEPNNLIDKDDLYIAMAY